MKDPQLKPDSEDVFRDINAARYPTFPTEPTVRSILALQPNFNLGSVDVMACGSTMGNLLRFVGSKSKPFRFDVDFAGGTVFFIRKENSPTEVITDIRGYGHTFPNTYTTWDSDVWNSCSHQRVIKYEFGGLRFLVRSEADGYVKLPTFEKTNNTRYPLIDAMGSMAVSSAGLSPDEKLLVQMQGTAVPQDQIFDIKTRSGRCIFDMNDILPRLWVNQTSKFLLAYHQHGLFDKPEVVDIRKDILDWQKNNSKLLGRFQALIKRILDCVRDSSHQQLEVSWNGNGPLIISKQIGSERRVLPLDLLDSWAAL